MEPLASHKDLKPGTYDMGTGTWPWDLGPGTWNNHTTWEESQAGVSGQNLFLAGWSLFQAGWNRFLAERWEERSGRLKGKVCSVGERCEVCGVRCEV